MAKRAKDMLIEGISGETPDGTVWAEVKISLQPESYESIGVTLGQSLRVEGSKANRKQARKQLLAECEQEVVAKAVEVRKAWRAKT